MPRRKLVGFGADDGNPATFVAYRRYASFAVALRTQLKPRCARNAYCVVAEKVPPRDLGSTPVQAGALDSRLSSQAVPYRRLAG